MVGNPQPGRRRPRTMKTTHGTIRPLIALVAVVAVLAGACTADTTPGPIDEGGPTTAPATTSPQPVDPGPEPRVEDDGAPKADDGWIDGEPDWDGSDTSEEASAEYEAMPEEATADEAMAEPEMAEETAAVDMTSAPAAAPASDDDYRTEDAVAYESEQPQAKLTGGSIDDNERFEDYLAYRADFFGLGIRVRDLDPSGRIVVTVIGQDRLPAAGAEVVVAGEGLEVSLRTTADGTVRFHPEAYDAGAGPFTVSAGDASTTATRGQNVTLESALPTATGETVALDVLFLLDATGSMDDEIHQLKITIDEVAQRIHRLPGDVDVRLGMTLYRDEGDVFLTRTFDFTPDVGDFSEALAEVVAADGGDWPEALDEALADALSVPSWRSAADTVQLVFLVADAPPQVLRQVPVPYTESMREAARRGIKIFPVSSSGTDDQAEFVFRQLAQFTGARYVFLTYGAGGRATGSATDIDQRDYEELSLDDLIVRLVAEELAALAEPTNAEPDSETTDTTQDDQQGN